MAQTSTTVAAISNVNNLSLANSAINLMVNLDKAAEDKKIANWFTSINFRTIQIDTFSTHTDGTGAWFINGPECRAWLSKDSLLWVKGSPGAGKTILSSIVIEYLQANFKETAIVFAYCRYSDRYSVTDILASFVKQLAQAHPSVVLPIIEPVYADHQRKETLISEQELQKIVKELLKLFKKAYIILDALDELPDDTRANLPTVLSSLRASLLITSRPLQLLEAPDAIVHIDNKNQHDIELFIDKKIEEPGHLKDMLKEKQLVRKGICASLKQVSRGMFLLAALQINSLKHCITVNELRKTVNSLPSGLDDLYRSTLARIESQPNAKISLARKAILWLTHTFRSLTIAELQHALAVSDEHQVFDEDDIAEENVIISVCYGLIAIDKESGIVRLVHETAYDFFRTYFSGANATPHTHITATCLAYLSAIGFRKQGLYELDQFLLDHSLGGYAYRHWGLHSRACYKEAGLPNAVRVFIAQCDRYPYDGKEDSKEDSRLDLLSPAHVAIRYGLLDALPPSDAWFNQVTGIRRCTPLILASDHGHKEIVELLLARTDVDINSQDTDGRTALLAASENGHEGIVRLLLSRGAGINTFTKRGTFHKPCWRTPLLAASENGHEGIVKLLLSQSDVNINSQDAYGRTPLFVASVRGRDKAIEMVLSRNDVAVNNIVNQGTVGEHRWQTTLHVASRNGHEGIVKLLVTRDDLDVNVQDGDGQTALIAGSKNGDDEIVELLLARKGVDTNLRDVDGRTALLAASENGHEKIVESLLSRGDVDVNSQDAYGRTALFVASEKGHDEVVRLLLSRNDVAVNNIISLGTRGEHCGQTALLVASKNRHEGIIKLLVGRSDIDINLQDTGGRTVLFEACENGNEEIVKLLLSRNDIDIHLQDEYGQTALFAASKNGEGEVVKLLLARNDLDINLQDEFGQTALFAASSSGEEEIVKLFLARNDVDINLQNAFGQTALFAASKNGEEAIVKLLLVRKDVAVNPALVGASSGGHTTILKLLLSRSDVDINSQDTDGRTALLAASENRDERIVKLLLCRNDVDINLQDAGGRTALFVACENGDADIADLLLSRNNFNINLPD